LSPSHRTAVKTAFPSKSMNTTPTPLSRRSLTFLFRGHKQPGKYVRLAHIDNNQLNLQLSFSTVICYVIWTFLEKSVTSWLYFCQLHKSCSVISADGSYFLTQFFCVTTQMQIRQIKSCATGRSSFCLTFS
jgi:hypothetical protein